MKVSLTRFPPLLVFALIFMYRQASTMGGCEQDYMWLARSISILWILVLLKKKLKCKSSVFCKHFPQPYRLNLFIDNIKKSYRDPFIFAMRLDDSLHAFYNMGISMSFLCLFTLLFTCVLPVWFSPANF